MTPPTPESLFAATAPGLEPVLLEEARALGAQARAVPGGVELEGPRGLCYRANLWLRTANRVLWRVGSVPSGKPEELSRSLAALPWRGFVAGGTSARLSVAGDGSSRGLDLANVLGKALRIPVSRVSAEEEGIQSSPHFFLREEQGRWTLSVDSSGTLLYKRGYRQEVSRAPLRETLAAGLLRLAGYRPGAPLWDPMCGSGTLVIEAAELARKLAPGAGRSFAFEHWPSFDAALWQGLVEDARKAPLTRAPGLIRASDIHSGSLGTARRNAKRAGVFEDLVLERLDATRLPPAAPGVQGLVLSNLPYGGRVGERRELGALYAALGRSLAAAVPGWRAALYVEDGELLARSLGLAPVQRFAVPNGGIRCELCVFVLP